MYILSLRMEPGTGQGLYPSHHGETGHAPESTGPQRLPMGHQQQAPCKHLGDDGHRHRSLQGAFSMV